MLLYNIESILRSFTYELRDPLVKCGVCIDRADLVVICGRLNDVLVIYINACKLFTDNLQ